MIRAQSLIAIGFKINTFKVKALTNPLQTVNCMKPDPPKCNYKKGSVVNSHRPVPYYTKYMTI